MRMEDFMKIIVVVAALLGSLAAHAVELSAEDFVQFKLDTETSSSGRPFTGASSFICTLKLYVVDGNSYPTSSTRDLAVTATNSIEAMRQVSAQLPRPKFVNVKLNTRLGSISGLALIENPDKNTEIYLERITCNHK